jgi:hypothetical protein
MLDILSSYGCQELFGIMLSVCVCFLYIADSSFVSLQRVVKSRKLLELCCSDGEF